MQLINVSKTSHHLSPGWWWSWRCERRCLSPSGRWSARRGSGTASDWKKKASTMFQLAKKPGSGGGVGVEWLPTEKEVPGLMIRLLSENYIYVSLSLMMLCWKQTCWRCFTDLKLSGKCFCETQLQANKQAAASLVLTGFGSCLRAPTCCLWASPLHV